MNKNKGWVVLLSGGLDSCALLGKIMNENKGNGDNIRCISFDYGQRHSKELVAARNICCYFDVEHRVVDVAGLREIMVGSSLTDNIDVPYGRYDDESMKITVVPNRNMIMLAIAGAYAISNGIRSIAYAAHAGDHAIYPDCREEFVSVMRKAFMLCDWNEIELVAPFVNKSKVDIVKLGAKLEVPFELTWSCYEGKEKHCGKCGTCVERKEAFALAGIKDPTNYEN